MAPATQMGALRYRKRSAMSLMPRMPYSAWRKHALARRHVTDYHAIRPLARVAKSVDARDLKSLSLRGFPVRVRARAPDRVLRSGWRAKSWLRWIGPSPVAGYLADRFVVVAFALLLSAIVSKAEAATGVVLPPWVCAQTDTVFLGGFEAGEQAVPHDPSLGSGGAYPGNRTRTVTVPGYGSHTYYLHVPDDYSPARSWP